MEDLPWMARLLAGLGMPFIIHHPTELRTVFRQYALMIQRLLKMLNISLLARKAERVFGSLNGMHL